MKLKPLRYILYERATHNFNSVAISKSSKTRNGKVIGTG